jgi:hypothetical protein
MSRVIGLALILVLGGASCGAPAPTGAPCSGGDDCKSGHCISDGNGNNRRCTGPCNTNADCPAGAPYCESLGFDWSAGQLWCVLEPPP